MLRAKFRPAGEAVREPTIATAPVGDEFPLAHQQGGWPPGCSDVFRKFRVQDGENFPASSLPLRLYEPPAGTVQNFDANPEIDAEAPPFGTAKSA